MTSLNGNVFRVTGPLWGESIGHRWIRPQRDSDAGFDVFFDVGLNKLPSCWWFETPWRSIWMISFFLNLNPIEVYMLRQNSSDVMIVNKLKLCFWSSDAAIADSLRYDNIAVKFIFWNGYYNRVRRLLERSPEYLWCQYSKTFHFYLLLLVQFFFKYWTQNGCISIEIIQQNQNLSVYTDSWSRKPSQRAHDAIITSLRRQNDVASNPCLLRV